MAPELAEKVRAAYGRLRANDLPGAVRLCGEILSADPRHPDALHLLGLTRLMSGRAQEAVSLLGRALDSDPGNAGIMENLGLAHLAGQEYAQAEQVFRRALALGLSHPSLHMRLGLALGSQHKHDEAVAALRAAASQAPADPDVHLNLGNVLADQGQIAEAQACFETVLALRPNHVDALYNLGTLQKRAGRHEEALAAYHRALAIAPGSTEVLNNLGTVHEQLGQTSEAIKCYRKVLAMDRNHVYALSNLGNALRVQGRLEEAAASCERALAAKVDFVDALINLGNVRLEQGRFSDAQAHFERSIATDPGNVDARRSLGNLFRTQGRLHDAIAAYRTAEEIGPGLAAVHGDLGAVYLSLADLGAAATEYGRALALNGGDVEACWGLAETHKLAGRLDQAIEAYERALALKPDFSAALSGLIYLRQHVCDWNGIDSLWERLGREAIGKPGSRASPFSVLNMPYSAEEQLACAREWARQRLDRLTAARPGLGIKIAPRPPHARLRIGYLSWDFHQHATSYLMAELFELHDRARYEVFAYSYGPDDGSPIHARIQSAVEHFVDVSGESFVDSARRIMRDEIDVLVDLKGYTLGSRPQIVALRPAPVQVNWLGYPGSMGTGCVDYVIADSFIVPEGAEHRYSEKVMRLPDCYQVNDRKREIAERTPTREESGLPAAGLVFCCFNQSVKILPDVFAVWMRVLQAVPGSVLWLLENNRWATENLRRAAANHDITPERLVFAPRKPMSEHLARYRVADLAIDTYPYGSHTTGSDALWAGCPLVTRAGETFASRVAGSLLTCVGLPELVTTSLEEYERLILELATHQDRLQAVRGKLRERRDSCALFDTPRFARNLEAAYEEMFKARGRNDLT